MREIICHSCGSKLEISPEQPPCKALAGWLTVSFWKEPKDVAHYNFCSFTCLKRWVDTQAPEIPKAFLKAFGDESKDGNNLR